MTLSKNQPSRGTQRSTSTNKTSRTGRDSMLKQNTSKRSVEHRVSKNTTKRSGKDAAGPVGPAMGIGRGNADRGSASVSGIPDGVGRELPSA